MESGFLLSLGAAGVGVIYAACCARAVLSRPLGDDAMLESHLAIREGASAFLRTQYGAIGCVGLVIFVALWCAPGFGAMTALGFAIGGLCSGASGAIGMLVSVRANIRTAAAAVEGVGPALAVASRAGAVTGFLVGALALASVCGFHELLRLTSPAGSVDLRPLAGLGFGASLISIFARLGGGIFTKAADVGADLAGKLEQGIPEDDPRNPAVIADNVGDNVGDCAGMAADVFESYAVTLVATLLVAGWILPGNSAAQQYPLVLGGVGLLASIVGMESARLGRGDRPLASLTRGVAASVLIASVGFYGAGEWLTVGETPYTALRLFAAGAAGLLVALGLVATTNHSTADAYRPVRRIAEASGTGHATNIITGLAVGMSSTTVPVTIIAVAVVAAYSLAGIYGIAVAACSMLALTPIVVSLDAYGPVTDNAGGIAQMGGMPSAVRDATDALDAVGNTTKAVTKAFAIGSAGLAALVLFAAYQLEFGVRFDGLRFALNEPYTLAGLLVGALLPYRFAGLAMDAVGSVAGAIVEEVRRQFGEHPDILAGTRKPDHARAIAMLTRASLRGMIAPALIPVLVPVFIAFGWAPLGPPGSAAQLMGGVLIGAIVTGLVLALSMCTGGAAWDNAKKYIEAGHEGGRGSFAHQAAITGDTVGDPYKDTAGPAINPMLKVLNLMAVLLVPFLI